MVDQYDPSALIQKFLADIDYSFVKPINIDNPIVEASNIFNKETQSEEHRRGQMNIFCNNCRTQISDIYQIDSIPAVTIISVLRQEVQFQDFFCTFDGVVKELRNCSAANNF